MESPIRAATRSLLCHGTWLTVEIEENRNQFDWSLPGGTFFGLVTTVKVKGDPSQFLRAALDHSFLSNDDEEREAAWYWITRAGYVAFIELMCKRMKQPVPPFICLRPQDYKIDPQQVDRNWFRKRCRFDVLRVIHDRLTEQLGSPDVSLSEVQASHLLTRLFSDNDIRTAMEYWYEKENILVDPTLGFRYSINENEDERVAELIMSYDWEEAKAAQMADTTKREVLPEYDVFICHAYEDKPFVGPLAQALVQAGLKVWYDETVLKLGDNLRRSIDKGLVAARYGIVVFSSVFFGKEWPQHELDGLAQREMSDGRKVILPVWHKISKEEIERYSPPYAGRLAVQSDRPINEIVQMIVEVVKG